MIALQAELTGIPLVQRKVGSDNFERELKSAVSELAGKVIKGMIFGDIHLAPHKEWVDRVCGDLNIEPIEPLWSRKTEDIRQVYVEEGFETIVASANQDLIDKKYIGRNLDGEFIEYLKSRRLDVCGEGGEFHTFVTKGPLFHGRIEIRNADVMSRDGFWFLNVHDYAVRRQGKAD